jgi:hypothetical protein
MLNFAEGGKPENREKNPRSKGENQQQTQLVWESNPGHSALTTAPPMLPMMI